MNYSTEQSTDQLVNVGDCIPSSGQVALKAIEAKQFNFFRISVLQSAISSFGMAFKASFPARDFKISSTLEITSKVSFYNISNF